MAGRVGGGLSIDLGMGGDGIDLVVSCGMDDGKVG